MQPLPFYQLGPDNFLLTVLYEDAPLHTDAAPFCQDMTCGCHTDLNLYREYVYKPYQAGLLTVDEGLRILWCRQILGENERITDEEIEQIMNEPSPLDVDIEENYHRPFFDGLDDH